MIASILYTSGTTGKPKGAMLTHANFTSNVEASVAQVGFYPSDNFLNILPLFHSFSFTANFILPLSLGGCCSFVRSVKTITEDMCVLQPTVMLAVPLLAEKIYARITEKLKKSLAARVMLAVGLRSVVGRKVRASFGGKLRLIGIGGAPTAHSVLRGFQKLGIPVLEGYGLTECAPGVAYPNLSYYIVGTVGQVLANMDYKLVDTDATGAGELCVRGPNVMKGYYKKPEATAEIIDADGFLHTGDLARFDDRKNLTICGRRKALIVNREGKNIYPEEIEQIIERCPYVKDIIVLGYHVADETGERIGAIIVPDEEALTAKQSEAVAARRGEAVAAKWRAAVAARRGTAAVEKRPPSIWSEAQTQEFVRSEVMKLCHDQLADYKLPRKIEFRQEPLERTSTMKVRRVVYDGALDEK
jgi:long-chain acyl-CoA synthetase